MNQTRFNLDMLICNNKNVYQFTKVKSNLIQNEIVFLHSFRDTTPHVF